VALSASGYRPQPAWMGGGNSRGRVSISGAGFATVFSTRGARPAGVAGRFSEAGENSRFPLENRCNLDVNDV